MRAPQHARPDQPAQQSAYPGGGQGQGSAGYPQGGQPGSQGWGNPQGTDPGDWHDPGPRYR
jgi:hypothetical protein